ncbi:hypothetical protein SCHPADRAFT_913761 [Schizopora paradoxa]|uniref:Pyridoxal phosphate homeostasis protein n=1 Tax=Schizopora paradoxa TaxID=27342 RepID=A0A0H2RYF5_9AGAM|nr:hypothetical protein SCHPADRAFT_913761 [Schizopora paradoxa]
MASVSSPNPERAAELAENLSNIRNRVKKAVTLSSRAQHLTNPLLIAVSKYKPSSDILECYGLGQRDFGENYVQELIDKAKELPEDIRWHFIGTLQSNKSKALSTIPNLYSVQTISSVKGADAINKALPPERESTPLNILLQVNTSGEDSKSGLPPLLPSAESPTSGQTEVTGDTESTEVMAPLVDLAKHIILNCPRLRLQGLMTIGALSESLSEADINRDFETLKTTRAELQRQLKSLPDDADKPVRWGEDGHLVLSMGMSSDFEAALKAGSDMVRVGTGIFGQRPKKETTP